jgi:sigma-B regulation protein RsbU (phosphoserine phosphatase)
VTADDPAQQPPPPLQILRTLPGRLLILSGAVALVLLAARQLVDLPEILEVFRKVASLAALVALGWIGAITVARNRRWLLWRVRRKLILSYVFLGFVPVLLVGLFSLAGSVVLYTNIAAFVFREGVDDLLDDVAQVAEATASELGRAPNDAAAILTRVQLNRSTHFPAISIALVPLAGDKAAISAPTAWRHAPAPTSLPEWLKGRAGGLRSVLMVAAPDHPEDLMLVVRAAMPTPDQTAFVIVDLPVDTAIVAQLDDRTGARMGRFTPPDRRLCGVDPPPVATGTAAPPLFTRTVAFMDCTNWATGRTARFAISVDAPLSNLYGRITSAPSAGLSARGSGEWDNFLFVLVVLAGLFLIVQVAALVFGAWLARSITSAVHELFEGTARVQQGDFAHRIRIESRDQLGDLASSFNRMSASIEHLLHVQREKQRLDDELRIARDIQKSLLPVEPPRLPGLGIADLCEPAREVGGDYYDFFDLGPRRLGVLVADVSGKGTSAALYMAELKGLMLALSHAEPSPRRLLLDVNRCLAGHLDNRSFVTMIYAVIDLEAGTLTCARAGHTPLIAVSNGRSEVIVPQGMVLGLRLPGASERFDQLLEEHTRPIHPGDVVILYTDGVTEAMNERGDLFGDDALADVVAHHHQLDAFGIRERVVREVRAFVGQAEPHDDMTLIVLKFDDEAAMGGGTGGAAGPS